MFHSQMRDTIAVSPEADGDVPLTPTGQQVARGLRRRSLAPVEIGLFAATVDAVTGSVALRLAGPDVGWGIAVIAGLATVALIALSGGYRLDVLRRLPRGAAQAALAGLAAAVAVRIDAEWLPLLFALALGFGIARAFVSAGVRGVLDFGLTERRAVILGGGPLAASLIEGLAANPHNDIRICAIFDDRNDDRSPLMVAGVPRIGTSGELLLFARQAEIDMVIVALPLEAEARIRQLLQPLAVLPLDIRLSAYSADMTFPRRDTSGGGGALLAVLSRPLAARDQIFKRGMDILGALVALVVFALPMAVIAVAIRLDSPGPILFRQQRHGFNHRPVKILKFRSMRVECEDATARQVVTRNDSRVTRVGRFLRRTSLDELPQFFNVLTGQLSMVGPRPHAVLALSSRQEAFSEMVEGYAARHRMRPGITGWAQINGWRGEIDDPEKLRRRFEHDLYYIENWSIWFDLKIVCRTPLHIIEGRNAY